MRTSTARSEPVPPPVNGSLFVVLLSIVGMRAVDPPADGVGRPLSAMLTGLGQAPDQVMRTPPARRSSRPPRAKAVGREMVSDRSRAWRIRGLRVIGMARGP